MTDFTLPKKVKQLDYVVTVLSIIGALGLSFAIWESYYLLLISSMINIWVLYQVQLRGALIRNCLFMTINLIGIYNQLT